MKGYDLPQRGLVSQTDGAIVQGAQVPRSKYTNQWTRKTAFNASVLVPILCDEILPGDHMSYDITAFVRMATPLFPQFDNLTCDTFFFFVPNRIVWDNWIRLMGEQNNYNSPIDYTVPQIEMTAAEATVAMPVGEIYDHMGVPPKPLLDAAGVVSINALPFRAYDLIFNQWFRDENLQLSAHQPMGDTGDVPNAYFLQRRCKAHDYFTSALPWVQKFVGTTVPIGTGAPVRGIGYDPSLTPQFTGGSNALQETDNNVLQVYEAYNLGNPTSVVNFKADPNTGAPLIYADLSESTGVAINTLRQAFAIQSLLERDARGGTRYVELIRSHFGVINPDFRLQRPEYIGGGRTPINITPIAQTAPTTGVPLGALGGAGTAAGNHRASYAATEHGYIIGLINVRAEMSYQQGLPRHFTRRTRYDFYFPALAGLGEQAILQKELYFQGIAAEDDLVWGYQERWHEYRQKYSEVTGIMRSGVPGTLDAWHLAEYWDETAMGATPALNEFWLRDKTIDTLDRVLAAAELAQGQQFLADILYRRTAVRPMPMFGTPVSLGRF